MGAILAKLAKFTGEPKTVSVHGSIAEDPRSPTEGVYRTPISIDKKSYLETDIDNATPSLPLRVKMLRKHIDPRSPTEGINRTPISLLQTSTDILQCESPVSLYSNYQTDMESLAFLTSPPEPSVNVSGFYDEKCEDDLEEVVKDISLTDINELKTPPKLKLRPAISSESKVICESLIKEIIDSFKECQDELKAKSTVKKMKNKSNVGRQQENPKSNSLKLSKARKPLANITSAGNTPTKLTLRKDDKLVKVELSGENSPMNIKTRTQWDTNSTLLI